MGGSGRRPKKSGFFGVQTFGSLFWGGVPQDHPGVGIPPTHPGFKKEACTARNFDSARLFGERIDWRYPPKAPAGGLDLHCA